MVFFICSSAYPSWSLNPYVVDFPVLFSSRILIAEGEGGNIWETWDLNTLSRQLGVMNYTELCDICSGREETGLNIDIIINNKLLTVN